MKAKCYSTLLPTGRARHIFGSRSILQTIKGPFLILFLYVFDGYCISIKHLGSQGGSGADFAFFLRGFYYCSCLTILLLLVIRFEMSVHDEVKFLSADQQNFGLIFHPGSSPVM